MTKYLILCNLYIECQHHLEYHELIQHRSPEPVEPKATVGQRCFIWRRTSTSSALRFVIAQKLSRSTT